jgi:hypothetical protein
MFFPVKADGLPKGSKRMNARLIAPFTGNRILTSVLTGLLVVAIQGAIPASAEKLYSKISKEEAKSLSGPLKTFICLGERLTPDWCEAYRNSKLVPRPRPKPKKKPEPAEIIEIETAAYPPEDSIVTDLDTKDIPDLIEIEIEETVAVEDQGTPEEIQRKEDWKIFTGTGDYQRLSAGNVELLQEMAESGKNPEAYEILGYAYTVGSGVIQKSKVKAYRNYGKAYLMGLMRVKPNMDVLWKLFTKSEQYALQHEFKRLRKEIKVSTTLNDSDN